MPMDDYILRYHQQIQDGSIIAGKWIKLLYQRIIDGIESGEYVYDLKKAHKAIKFIERYCRHNKGKLAPGFIKLSLWQKAAVSCIYGIVDQDGKRIFKEVFFLIGRKCGKALSLDNLNAKAGEFIQMIRDGITEKVNDVEAKVTEFKDNVVGKFNEIKTGIKEKIDAVKTTLEGMKTKAGEVFDGIKDSITEKIESAKEKVHDQECFRSGHKWRREYF